MAGFYAKWTQDMEDAQQQDGGLSSTVPYAKHQPPVDPTWPTAYPQLLHLLHQYYADVGVVDQHYESVKAYVDYVGAVKTCPSCRAPTNKVTQTPDGLPWFYMNGDWMEYKPQGVELATSGPPLSSYHYIKDLGLVAGFGRLLSAVYDRAGKAESDPAKVHKAKVFAAEAMEYASRAKNATVLFNKQYLRRGDGPSPQGPPKTCGESKELKKGGKPIELWCCSYPCITRVSMHHSCIHVSHTLSLARSRSSPSHTHTLIYSALSLSLSLSLSLPLSLSLSFSLSLSLSIYLSFSISLYSRLHRCGDGTRSSAGAGAGGGGIIDKIVFASFGTPTGHCTSDTSADFTANASCAAKTTMAIVSKACLNKRSCTLQVLHCAMTAVHSSNDCTHQ
jgi:hypothetical protein